MGQGTPKRVEYNQKGELSGDILSKRGRVYGGRV